NTSALAFDGVDDAVSMGVASELGLATFTVEAWVRRDGKGAAAGTGVGGLALVPIAGKGRGEDDGSNVDCNYQFGFFGDVLGADFEDSATGLNHPIVGATTVSWGIWHHVAATYDGTTWRLYLDGKLDAEVEANATPRADSIQHFGLGAAFNSTGVAAGALLGALDEVRVWDHARTEAEIDADKFKTLTSGQGLVGRWALENGEAEAANSAGPSNGTITGALYETPGAVLDLGAPPTITQESPDDGATLDAASVELEVTLDDPDQKPMFVTFHLRDLSEGDDFTIVVLPDTQYYTRPGDNHDYFYDQTKWIMDNADEYNIVAVIHNGDIVDNGGVISQWNVADQAMSTLEAPQDGFPEGMPYGVCVGNHDQSPNSADNSTTNFNVYFGVDRFADKSYYGGHYADDNDENWFTFQAGGVDFVVVNFQYDLTPDDAVLAWGRSIFESHPEAFGIVNSHYIVGGGGNFGAQGQAIYDTMKDVQNVHLMTNGHVANEKRRTDEFEGHVIHSMLADYQGRPNGGGGLLRIWEFSPANDELTVRTYSPTDDLWETDEESEFTLPVKLDGVGGVFQEAAKLDPVTTTAKTVLSGLVPGRTYEWYATVGDCAHAVTTPLRSFTTSP
ncbi:MAG: phosphohydrolase, partial [Polyangiaceae bacterium]|nr:phosphohydrolase [Polyangiaceae bacterium]